jgi:phage terminase small subunit
MRKLSDKQTRFVQEYLIDQNATKAAVRAGYSAKTAHSQGPRMLEHVGVKAEIEKRQAKLADKLEIKAESIAEEFLKMASYDPGEVMTWTDDKLTLKNSDDMTPAQRKLITEIKFTPTQFGTTKQIKLTNRMDALQNLARHLGMFKDRIEFDVTDDLAALAKEARQRAAESRIKPTGGERDERTDESK